MGKSILDLLEKMGMTNYALDMDIVIPLSKEDEFSNTYNSKRWNGDEKGNDLILYPPTMGVRRAKRFCRELPKYAKVSNVKLYPPHERRIFSGPLDLSVEQEVSFLEKLVKYEGTKVSNMETTLNSLEKKLGIILPLSGNH